jgi:anti-anti-sigma factor
MASGHVIHAEKNGVHVLRYFGRADYTAAPGIQRFMDDLVVHGRVSGLVFDLTQAENLDSTNLGLLARLAEQVRGAGGPRSVIISQNEDINCVLRSMCFDQIFDIVTEDSNAAARGGHEIRAGRPTQEDLRQTMLEAHRALIRVSRRRRVSRVGVSRRLRTRGALAEPRPDDTRTALDPRVAPRKSHGLGRFW